MKKLLISACLILCPAAVFAQAEVIDTDGFCVAFDADGNFFGIPESVETLVYSASPSGSWKATCHGQMPEQAVLPDRATFITAESLGAPVVCNGSSDWVQRLTPSGRFNITCHGSLDD